MEALALGSPFMVEFNLFSILPEDDSASDALNHFPAVLL